MDEIKEEVSLDNNHEKKNIKKPTSKRKVIGLVIIVLVLTGVVAAILASIGDFSKTMDIIGKIETKYLWISILCVILYLLSWPISIMILSRKNKAKVSQLDNFLVGSSEHFFNAITPFSSGGQPIQIYLYTQNGMSAANATGIVISNFIAFMIATNGYAIASLFFFDKFTASFNASTIWMIFLGFVMNLFTLFFIISIASSSKVRNLLIKLFKKLGKIKFLTKFIDKTAPKFENYCNNFQLASKEIMSNIPSFIFAILSRTVSLVFYYSIPYFILKGLGVNLTLNDMIFIILASSFTITTMVWVPTPGGTGGIEFAFSMIFIVFFSSLAEPNAIVTAGMIIWRFLTYYLLMFLSGMMYLTYEIIIKRRKKKALSD